MNLCNRMYGKSGQLGCHAIHILIWSLAEAVAQSHSPGRVILKNVIASLIRSILKVDYP